MSRFGSDHAILGEPWYRSHGAIQTDHTLFRSERIGRATTRQESTQAQDECKGLEVPDNQRSHAVRFYDLKAR